MDHAQILDSMREDWNRRAAEDANYYVAFRQRDQDEDEFFAMGAPELERLEADLPRLPGRDAALEIGCGPGRLMRPLSRLFQEIHGVDVSDGMIALARQRLRSTPNAFPHHSSGCDLKLFPDEKFDFVYSYAVFQHIPSVEVVFQYLREARRVLKNGGIVQCQVNGLPAGANQYDTWNGARIGSREIAQFALANDFQLLGLEAIDAQYMWVTLRKRPAGWTDSLAGRRVESDATIRNITNAVTTHHPVTPASGPMAALSLWIERLPDECDLNHMAVSVDGVPGRAEFIGSLRNGAQRINVWLPEGTRTGMVPVEVTWLERTICPTAWTRIVPPGPSAPRLAAVTDGVNLQLYQRTISGFIKVTMIEVPHAGQFHATVDGKPVREIEAVCTDQILQRYEYSFRMPECSGPGGHVLEFAIGKRAFPPIGIEVA